MTDPAPFLAQEEQNRADALALRIAKLNTEPERWDVGAYQHAARAAYETSAARTEQPH